MDLYFDCTNGISGDMAVGALIDLGGNIEKLKITLDSMHLEDEFEYKISKMMVNGIQTSDFNVIIPQKHHHNHAHRNLFDINKIIDKISADENVKAMAKKIFEVIAKAEAKVHKKDIKDIHFHEIGAIDSIVDIVSFCVLYSDLNPEKTYISALSEGYGNVECQHGTLSVPVPAVCEILRENQIKIKLTDNEGEMITPTGAGIVSVIDSKEKLKDEFLIKKTGYGRGKRNYKNPTLKVMKIERV